MDANLQGAEATRQQCARLVFPPDGFRGLSNGVTDAPLGSWMIASSRAGGVNGPQVDVVWDLQPDSSISIAPETAASKFRAVGLPPLDPSKPTFNSYYRWWVVAAAPDFRWAFISGGRLTPLDYRGCGPNLPTWYGSGGMMVVARNAQDAQAVADAQAALSTVDWAVMTPVQQEGCTYPQSFPELCSAQ